MHYKYIAGLDSKRQGEQSTTASFFELQFNHDVDTLLRVFWEIGEFKSPKSSRTNEEELCVQHFIKNTIFTSAGEVQVRLPFKSNIYQLGSSFEKRLLKDDTLRKMYIEFIDEYTNPGHMSPVSFDKLTSSHYIIPHHCLFVLKVHRQNSELSLMCPAAHLRTYRTTKH